MSGDEFHKIVGVEGEKTDVATIVRVRYRMNNKAGAKELHDDLYAVSKDGKVALPLPGFGAGEWPAVMKAHASPHKSMFQHPPAPLPMDKTP